MLTNSVWGTTCKQIHRLLVTQIRLTESITRQRANRPLVTFLLLSCQTFESASFGFAVMNRGDVGVSLQHPGMSTFLVKCGARHRCARLVREARLLSLSSLKGQSAPLRAREQRHCFLCSRCCAARRRSNRCSEPASLCCWAPISSWRHSARIPLISAVVEV